MKSAITHITEKDTPLRFITGSGVTISGATKAECVEDYVRQVTARHEANIAEDEAYILNARMQIAELMQSIEEREYHIQTARNLIRDYETWLDWQKLSPEEYLHCLTTPIPF